MTYMNYMGSRLERRFAPRVRVEMYLTQYIHDQSFRALATNLSPEGLLIQKLVEPRIPPNGVVSVEFEIPGTGETVWALAESRFDERDENFHISGLTFTGMAARHERLLQEFVYARKLSRRAPYRARFAT
jgi:PilZ domain